MYQSNQKGIILKIRDSRTFKGLAVYLSLSVLFEIIHPNVSLALTEGPSQPEVQSFEPIGTTQMVDLFTGDFNYNIPLFNLPGPNGGYPVNLAYHAGISMDDEASWVGLGWNINAGSLVRNVRGLPDEFKSVALSDEDGSADGRYDNLEVQTDMKESWTLGIRGGVSFEALGANVTGLNLSASVYYNNYSGLGASVGADVSVGKYFSAGLSMDSESGMGVSASLSLTKTRGDFESKHTLTLSFDGAITADYSLKRTETKHISFKLPVQNGNGGFSSVDIKYDKKLSSSFGSGITFARNSFSPSVNAKMRNYNISASLTVGVEAVGAFAGWSLGVFYNTQDYSNKDKKGRKRLVAGYEKEDAGLSNLYTRDFVRSNDGQITKSSMFLPSTHFTYDTYSSTGQGLGGYFRARRADIGRSYDPFIRNTTMGASVSFDMGAGGLAKLGVDGGINFGWDTQGPWDNENDFKNEFKYVQPAGINEMTYYQAHGEPTVLDLDEMKHINGMNLPFVRLVPKSDDGLSGGKRKIDNVAVPNNEYQTKRVPQSRVVRNTLIHSLQNEEVGKLGEFNVNYFTNANQVFSSPSQTLNREKRKDVFIHNHNAGYKILNEEGSYYVYALPAYNNKEVENSFSVGAPENPYETDLIDLDNSTLDYKVAGSHKYINKVTKSPYAHSYLLTGVQGADYVDVTNNGPSDDDLGYWVKFNYVNYSPSYKWRAPYAGAFYNQGAIYSEADDKATYQYGEKEMWYLGRIETKSHIAVFKMSGRDDNREASAEIYSATDGTQNGLKIDEIRIYEKKSFMASPNPENLVPLQTVHFEYDYELAKQSPNSTAPGKGKLTLKKLWFTSNGSERGKLSSYDFDYTKVNVDASITNPDYKRNGYDMWGTTRPIGNSYEHHAKFPYVNQFNQDWNEGVESAYHCWTPSYSGSIENQQNKNITKETQDNLASAWCLRSIKLPSGGVIKIDYESDDYGYVQHKTANQMFKITKLGDGLEPDELYNAGNTDFNDEANRRIYFKLEYPIRIDNADIPKKVYSDYVEPLIQDENKDRNLFFKSKMRLVKNSGQDVYDYVSGYLPLEAYTSTRYGVKSGATAMVDGFECYTEGFVTIKKARKKKKEGGSTVYYDNYHPMALAAWTYMQTDAQELLSNSGNLSSTGTVNSPGGLPNIIGALSSFIPSTFANFGAIRKYCKEKEFARFISRRNSCIKLASPDKIKYGGGHRVREISITDNWSADVSAEESKTYGQRYDYTIVENGKTISSGVAQYEPQAGGDENALKYPIYYFDKQTLLTRNNLFAEAPMNESLFPGASVGYRKVTTRSIHTDERIKAAPSAAQQGRTSGVTVNEFFTAKDFPTLVEYSLLAEENSTKDIFNLPIMIPLIGSIKRNYYHGTQAYKIELNDMHGKSKSVETFELNGYKVNPKPITSSVSEYQMTPLTYQGESVYQLDNYVSIISNDGSHKAQTTKRLMGVEYDLFTDQRQSKTFYNSGNLALNVDVPPFPIPLLTFWITYSNHKSLFRTYVTNKVIHKAGIMKKTKSRDLQTVNESEIIAYDEKSGQPMLSRIKNEFGDDFYSYNIPAYYAYDGMGHAYKNINYQFNTTISTSNPAADPDNKTVDFEIVDPSFVNHLVRGDELLITDADIPADKYKKAYFLGFKYNAAGVLRGILRIDPGQGLVSTTQELSLKVIRSGRRNHYNVMAANYLSKGKITDIPLTNELVHTSPVDGSSIYTPKIAGNVLSATASLFKEDWLSTQSDQSFFSENPYLSANSGIWRPFKSYTYTGSRSQAQNFLSSAPASSPDLSSDGVINNVPMFTWDIGNVENHLPHWEWVNEITRFSRDNFELENKNRLDIYSSALYGYDNSLTIGVSQNAAYFESGVTDFETVPENGEWELGASLKQTNLNFHNKASASSYFPFVPLHYDILSGKYILNVKELEIVVNIPYSSFIEMVEQSHFIDFASMTLNSTKNNASAGNKGYYFNGVISGDRDLRYGQIIVNGKSCTRMRFKLFVPIHTMENALLPNNSEYTGKISFPLVRYSAAGVAEGSSSTQFVKGKAHTGKKSMKVVNEISYGQSHLMFEKNKEYVLSMWISRDNTNVPTYKPASGNVVEIQALNLGGALALTPRYSYGKVVEGWQKVDITFSIPENLGHLYIKFLPGSQPLYVDDVRCSPKTGGMTSYVYDSMKFWLRATLNIDNYATLFYYDEEGNLTLKKQETEKGIFTISESRGHVSEN